MAINFPSSPTLNQVYTFGNKTWTFDGTGWALNTTLVTPAINVLAPSYSGSLTVNVAGLVDVVRITLTGNLVLGFTGGTDGQKFIVELTQDGVGSRTLAYDASVVFGTDITGTTLTTTASKTDRIGFIYNSGTGKYSVIAFAKGY